MVFFVGVRRGVSYFFFSFGAAAHLPNMRNISLRGPSGRVAQWRTAVPLYFQKSLSLGTTAFFFFLNELRDCLRVIALRLTGL